MIKIVLSILFVFTYATFILLKGLCLILFKYVCYQLSLLVLPTEVKKWLLDDIITKSRKISGGKNFDYANQYKQLISAAKISPPHNFDNLSSTKPIEVKLLSGLVDDNSGLDQGKLFKGLLEALFYCSTNERAPAEKINLKYSLVYVRRYHCQGQDAGNLNGITTIIIFLLLDSPKQAYECIRSFLDVHAISGTRFLEQFTLFLQNGRQKSIPNWDFKVLAAYIKSYGALFPFNENNFDFQQSQELIAQSPEQSVIKGFEELCLKIKGNEENYLSPFRCKVVDLFGQYNISEVFDILEKLHLRFYGTSLKKKSTCNPSINIMNGSEENPFIFILQFLIDGHINETMSNNEIENLFKTGQDLSHKIEIMDKISPMSQTGRLVKRGECLIINQVFKDNPQLYREGTEKDEESLIRTWNMIGCKEHVTVVRDLTKEEILSELKRFRLKLQKTRPDFMVIAILSHGFRDKRTGCDFIMDINKEGMSVTSIKNMFINGYLCRSMIGKPKLFFIQACRGKFFQEALSNMPRQQMMPYDFSETDGENDEEKMLESGGVKYAHKSWFFIFHSTDNYCKGYISLRDPTMGTVFIQALCKVLNESWYINDISTIAMEVNRSIMKVYGSTQAPIFENQLGNPVYFEAIKR